MSASVELERHCDAGGVAHADASATIERREEPQAAAEAEAEAGAGENAGAEVEAVVAAETDVQAQVQECQVAAAEARATEEPTPTAGRMDSYTEADEQAGAEAEEIGRAREERGGHIRELLSELERREVMALVGETAQQKIHPLLEQLCALQMRSALRQHTRLIEVGFHPSV
jgi:hypothetical protein